MGYINHVSRLKILARAAEAVRLLNRSGFLAIVVSNQAGAARGYFPTPLIETVNELMKTSLENMGARLDGIFCCPHHPRSLIPELRMDCDCRKPGTGLIDQACSRFEIDMSRSYVVGDRCDDIELARRCGIGGVLVKTGYGRGEAEYVLPTRAEKPVHIAEELYDAVLWILEKEKTGIPQ
ncbi:MAG: HAD-IIIA family hydrolase [Desulfobacteraceae bacterium]|nr:MAG: HAD-IIIA family hydrolase [Desulfobacteraceae bacterium]